MLSAQGPTVAWGGSAFPVIGQGPVVPAFKYLNKPTVVGAVVGAGRAQRGKLLEDVSGSGHRCVSFSVLPVAWVLLGGPIPQLHAQNLLE